MSSFLKEHEKLASEEVLDTVPYKPFSILTITNQRIIGKGFTKIWHGQFHGELFFEDITNIKYNNGSLFMTPAITLEYQGKDGKIKTSTITFYGLSATAAGFDSKKIYELLLVKVQISRLNR